jgi:hypothetical protein
MHKELFPKRTEVTPIIYAYELLGVTEHEGLIKIGQTGRDAKTRVKEQVQTVGVSYKILLEESAMRDDGSVFSDHDIHAYLRNKGFDNPSGEWFKCSLSDLRAALIALRTNNLESSNRSLSFKMRPEQAEAVSKASTYFRSQDADAQDSVPHFLWNAKMRFGKTFASYKLAQEMGWKKILVLTFKPAVQNAWEEDLKTHIDFDGWQFISPGGLTFGEAKKNKPIVCFGSFQDYLGKNRSTGGIKTKNEWVHATNWDCVIFDEYHYGAWRENAKELFDAEDSKEIKFCQGEGIEDFDESIMPITTNAYLYLSGTPFRALSSGEFIEEQIFNWTYSDEQAAKVNWTGEKNPYAALPRMVLMTYQLPESIRKIAVEGEFNEFDLNLFFKAKGEGVLAEFIYKDEVQKWLEMIRGSLMETAVDNLKMGAKKPPLPFADARLLSVLSHTFWFLPNVASCFAMSNLLAEPQNTFYHNYKVIVAAGNRAGIGVKALPPVIKNMQDPLHSKTITLSCGKLTTGVTVKPWTGIFMLRNVTSPETYFQAAFRVQSPWSVRNPEGDDPNREEIIKQECYVFDFAPNRALRQVAEYSGRLNVEESNPEKKVEEFIKFLPVLAYDGSAMKQINAAEILDIAMSGTSATLLAKRWESTLLVNVDNSTLQRLMNNPDAMKALMSIEGFRSLNQDLETIINKSESVQKAKREANDDEINPKKKKELTDEEKEVKSLRKQVQEKLIKFATRIPIFMYLTDYRERSLKDVITQLEPGLFQRVTGLSVKDFELLVSLGVFNGPLMNDAVFKFKRYEDASLNYTGIDKHKDENVGGFDTVVSAKDYDEMAVIEAQ